MRNIRQNLFFALAYNGIGIPVAAGVLYPAFGIRLSPIIAAAAMAASSLSVVGNANRLRRYHPAPLPAVEVADVEPLVQAGSAHRHDAADRNSGQHGHASAVHGRTGHTDDSPAPGATVTDPVCGMRVNPVTAAAKRDIGGSAVYFCSAGCATAFDAEPERYAATTGTADC